MKTKVAARAIFAVAFACLGGLSTASEAATVTVNAQFTGLGEAKIVNVNFTNPYNGSSDPGHLFNGAVWAGELNWSASPLPLGWSNFIGPTTFTTYCIEFAQHVGTSPTLYTAESLADAPKPFGAPTGNPSAGMGGTNGLGTGVSRETLVRQLYNRYVLSGELDDIITNDGVENAIEKAAFQVAVWKVIYEETATGYANLSLGNIQFSAYDGSFANISSLATQYLGDLILNAGATTGSWRPATGLIALTNELQQDQLFFNSDLNITSLPVPLPMSAMSGGALLACLLGRRVRRG